MLFYSVPSRPSFTLPIIPSPFSVTDLQGHCPHQPLSGIRRVGVIRLFLGPVQNQDPQRLILVAFSVFVSAFQDDVASPLVLGHRYLRRSVYNCCFGGCANECWLIDLLNTSEASCEVDTRWFVDLSQLWSRGGDDWDER
jgi:hypothetical protein